jgi:hypothetical protein
MTFPTEIIPEIVGLAVTITRTVLNATGQDVTIDEDAWRALGPKIETLVAKAISGEDISHDELMQYIPDDLRMRMLQTAKRVERINAGLPV